MLLWATLPEALYVENSRQSSECLWGNVVPFENIGSWETVRKFPIRGLRCYCVYRSLVALSLILSLLLFKPAPVYILDEVDAALDLSHTQVHVHTYLLCPGCGHTIHNTHTHTHTQVFFTYTHSPVFHGVGIKSNLCSPIPFFFSTFSWGGH